MDGDQSLSGLVQEQNGSYSAAYGPFVLKSAFQPIFSQSPQGALRLEAFEALIRPFQGHEPAAPAQFFALVEPGDGAAVERLCRRLHIANAGISDIGNALIFLNISPQFLTSYGDMAREARSLAERVGSAGLSSSQIVCEIVEKRAAAKHLLAALADTLREHNFRIAVDDYGAEDSDFDRVEIVRPDIVKFDALWVQRFLETSEGFALLGTMVRRFRDNGILTLFEGLEEHWQVAACRDLGVRLLQGYALAQPKLAPVRSQAIYDAGEPARAADESSDRPAQDSVDDVGMTALGSDRRSSATARRAVFGRRGR
ncbi:MAG TPA: EAL domain-containing protein [Pararhizobium sp.]|nr:EAL domain-containing protein [Pararhizobium sp.]